MGNSNGFDIAKLRTANNTPTVLWNRVVNAGDFILVRVIVLGRKADGSQVAGFRREFYAYNPGAGAQYVGNAEVPLPDVNTPGWAVTMQITGNEAQVLVTGAAATSIEWTARVEVVLA